MPCNPEITVNKHKFIELVSKLIQDNSNYSDNFYSTFNQISFNFDSLSTDLSYDLYSKKNWKHFFQILQNYKFLKHKTNNHFSNGYQINEIKNPAS